MDSIVTQLYCSRSTEIFITFICLVKEAFGDLRASWSLQSWFGAQSTQSHQRVHYSTRTLCGHDCTGKDKPGWFVDVLESKVRKQLQPQ